jgi:hypothetical protein
MVLLTNRALRHGASEPAITLPDVQTVRVGVKAGVLAQVETSALRQVDLGVVREPERWLPPEHPAVPELEALIEAEAAALAKLEALSREKEADAQRRVTDREYRASPRPDFARLQAERAEAAAAAEADLVLAADALLEKLRSEAPENVARLEGERAEAEREAAEAERVAREARERADGLAQESAWWDGQAPRPRVPVLAWFLAVPARPGPTIGESYESWFQRNTVQPGQGGV